MTKQKTAHIPFRCPDQMNVSKNYTFIVPAAR